MKNLILKTLPLILFTFVQIPFLNLAKADTLSLLQNDPQYTCRAYVSNLTHAFPQVVTFDLSVTSGSSEPPKQQWLSLAVDQKFVLSIVAVKSPVGPNHDLQNLRVFTEIWYLNSEIEADQTIPQIISYSDSEFLSQIPEHFSINQGGMVIRQPTKSNFLASVKCDCTLRGTP